MRIEHYVEYLYPGSLYSEEKSRRIAVSQDLSEALKHLEPGCFAFLFYDVQVISGTLETGKKIEDGTRQNESGRYYPDATVYTLDQVLAMSPEPSCVATNMECNDWDRVVKTRRGNWQPFLEKDTLVYTAPTASTEPSPSDVTNKKENL